MDVNICVNFNFYLLSIVYCELNKDPLLKKICYNFINEEDICNEGINYSFRNSDYNNIYTGISKREK
ncbi:hypothetical protein CLOSBL3_11318 [Clostridiaceae bacterium BL-3]|nr:hypothetical protein CLOSBL3_11318 [Clostridiaceae bacterium BL-3]